MFTLQIPAWDVAVRTTIVYLVLLAALRVAGKREIGQLTLFDLVVLLLISNAVQNAMVGPDVSVTGGLIAAGVLLLINQVVAQLRLRSVRLRHLVEGTPTVLVLHGEVIQQHLAREGVDKDTLEAAMREHGFSSLDGVEMAVLETDGSISFVPAGQETKRTPRLRKYMKHA